MSKFQVTHVEYRKVAGYPFPMEAIDAELDDEKEAQELAFKLRDKNRETYFVTPIINTGTAAELPKSINQAA